MAKYCAVLGGMATLAGPVGCRGTMYITKYKGIDAIGDEEATKIACEVAQTLGAQIHSLTSPTGKDVPVPKIWSNGIPRTKLGPSRRLSKL